MHFCMCMCVQVYIPVCGGQRSMSGVLFSLLSPFNFFLIQSLLLTLELTSWLDWLASMGSPLSLSIGFIGMLPCVTFSMGARITPSVFMPSSQPHHFLLVYFSVLRITKVSPLKSRTEL